MSVRDEFSARMFKVGDIVECRGTPKARWRIFSISEGDRYDDRCAALVRVDEFGSEDGRWPMPGIPEVGTSKQLMSAQLKDLVLLEPAEGI